MCIRDRYIKHALGAKYYVRYMDDFIILSPDKHQLREWLAEIEKFLRERLKLELNPKTAILSAKKMCIRDSSMEVSIFYNKEYLGV